MFKLEWELGLDYWRQCRWGCLMVVACATGLLLVVFGALRVEGGFEPASVEAVQMHVCFAGVLGVCAASVALAVQGNLTRFFARPIGTTHLVVCQLTFGMATVAGLYVTVASLLNFVAGTTWPLWGPALFFAATMVCAQASTWWTIRSQFAQVAACVAIVTPLAIWYSRRYGATVFGDWKFMWVEPTLVELATLLALTAGGYLTAIFAVARHRRGEWLDFSAVAAWLAARCDWPARRPRKFRSAQEAQLWFEWRQRFGNATWILQMFLIGGIVALRLAGWISSHDMVEALFVLPMFSLVLMESICSLSLTSRGISGQPFKISTLLATRPQTDASLAGMVLRTAGGALLATWGVWLVGLAAGVLVCLKLEGANSLEVWSVPPFGPWSYPLATILVLIASWAALGLLIAFSLSGRPVVLFVICGVVGGAMAGFQILAGEAYPESRAGIVQVLLALGGGLMLAGAAWVIHQVRHRQLVPERTIWLVLAGWIALTTLSIAICLSIGVTNWGWLLQLGGLCALVVLPRASAPLALSWNRHG